MGWSMGWGSFKFRHHPDKKEVIDGITYDENSRENSQNSSARIDQ